MLYADVSVCAVLVCSDSTAAGTRIDQSGKIIQEMLESFNAEVPYFEILPDDKQQIQQQILEWVRADVPFIFTTGGTGLGPRDNTVSAVEELLEHKAEGIAEAMRVFRAATHTFSDDEPWRCRNHRQYFDCYFAWKRKRCTRIFTSNFARRFSMPGK